MEEGREGREEGREGGGREGGREGGRREGGGREGEGGRREGGGREGEGGRKSTCRESDGVGKLVLIFVHKLVHINQPCVHLGIEKGEVP